MLQGHFRVGGRMRSLGRLASDVLFIFSDRVQMRMEQFDLTIVDRGGGLHLAFDRKNGQNEKSS
jgi:hypothetical protein